MTRSGFVWVSVLACLGLVACGGRDGLSVMGSVDVSDGDELHTGFPFPQETALDEGGTPGQITGSCEMRRTLDPELGPQWGVVAILRGETREGRGLSSITVMGRTNAPAGTGRIEAELGTTPYVSEEGACDVEVEYADGGEVGLAGVCGLTGGGDNAVATVDLQFSGCEVAED